jgi:Ca-activated chloride channel family protein
LVVPATRSVPECTGTAFVFVLDRSGSMSGEPIARAKDAAVAGIGALGANDCFGLVAFDSVPVVVVPLSLVDAPAMTTAIRSIAAGGGTEIHGALVAASRVVAGATRAKHRGVLLLTDGQAALEGVRDVVAAMHGDDVVVSSIGLGGGVDESFLKTVAETGGGRFYKVSDAASLPRVIPREITFVRKPPPGP